MAAVPIPVEEETSGTPEWGEAPPPILEEQEMDILAFELWQQASRPASEVEEEEWLGVAGAV